MSHITNEDCPLIGVSSQDLMDLGWMLAIVRSQVDYDVGAQEFFGDMQNFQEHQQVADTLYLICNTIFGSQQLTQ